MSTWAGRAAGLLPTADEWRDILEKHARWWRGAEGGERAYLQGAYLQGADLQGAYLQGADLQRADLQGADLQRADLKGAYLQGAYLQGADLQGAYLQGADLQGAYLKGAYLQGAYLQGADLQGAYLKGAYLQGADLQGAYLQGADLKGAYLKGADLKGAYLQGAYLKGADLQRADLQGAYLQGADLKGAYLQGAYLQGADLTDVIGGALAIARTRILPEGELIGWKKLKRGAIACLVIPVAAKRSHAFGRKCRAEFAYVSGIVDAKGSPITEGESMHSSGFIYRVGETVHPNVWDDDWKNECAGGIHFYITREEAEDHQ